MSHRLSRSALPLALLASLALAACSGEQPASPVVTEPVVTEPVVTEPVTPQEAATEQAGAETQSTVVEVAEAFLTEMIEADNIDSPAAWRAPDGATWVISTAKATDQLLVYDGDTGETLQRIGQRGDELGAFKRPNGVFVLDDLLLVVERDNRRVQVMRLPGFKPVTVFGSDDLIKPYGLWARRIADGIELFVTDAYMAGEDEQGEDILPPLAELDQRVKRFLIREDGDGMHGRLLGSFGDTSEEGAVRVVESIWGDPATDRLLIAEEDETYANEIKVYTLAGAYAGQTFGRDIFAAQAEGIALFACEDGSGYWLTTEQGKSKTLFHVFDRQDLRHLGAFGGRMVANTDGIWLHQAGTNRFPAGVLYAVHDDQGMVALDWREIAAGLSLRESCEPN